MVARTVAAFGKIDCAFNNAGISGRAVGPVGQRTHEMSRAVVRRHACGQPDRRVPVHEARDRADAGAGPGGAIVNTASVAGLVGLPTATHYVAAKHGVVGLTKTAAMEYAQDKIRVNCVNPGYIKTPMTDER